jgi:hypothetical protein
MNSHLPRRKRRVAESQVPFDGRCTVHPRYNPAKDGRPQNNNCAGCESLYVIFLYTGIAQRKAETGDGLFVLRPAPQADAETNTGGEEPIEPVEETLPLTETQGSTLQSE